MDIKEFKIHQSASCKNRHPWELARLSIVTSLFTRVLKQTPLASTIADIGCGDAFIISSLSKRFPALEFSGIDSALTDEQIFAFSEQAHFNRCSFFNSFDKLIQTRPQQDIVLLLDVLEHVENEVELLQQVSSLLKPSGRVLVTVPAFDSLFCSHDIWLGHFRRYSRKYLERIIIDAGLVPVQTGSFFSGLLLPRVLYKFAEFFRQKQTSSYAGIGEWRRGPLLSGIMKHLLTLNGLIDLRLSQYGLPHTGLSIYAICKKSA